MTRARWFSRLIFEQPIELTGRNVVVITSLFIFRVTLNVLDLLGVGLIAFLVGAASSGVYPTLPFYSFGLIPEGDISQGGALLVSSVAVSLFVLKAGLAISIVYFSTRYSAFLEARYSSRLVYELASVDDSLQSKESLEDIQLRFTRGARARISGLLNSKLDLVGEISLFIILISGMLLISPVIGLSILTFLSFSLLVLLRLILKNVRRQQKIVQDTDIHSLRVLRNIQSILVELRLSRQSARQFWGRKLFEVRHESGLALSNLRLLEAAPRYALEVLALMGLMLLIGTVVILSSFGELGSELGFALGALFRMGTSLIPIQSAMQYLQVSRTDSQLSSIAPGAELANTSKMTEKDSHHPKTISLQKGQSFSLVGGNRVLLGDDLKLKTGEWVSIVGPSGVGKSSLLKSIIAFQKKKSKGSQSLGYCPQSPSLIPGGLIENLLLEESDDELRSKRALEIANSVGLYESDFPKDGDLTPSHNLSGGQLLRLGIARALSANPSCLILDEPTSSLDFDTSSNLLEWLRGNYAGGVLIASHDPNLISKSDHIFRLGRKEKGHILLERMRPNTD